MRSKTGEPPLSVAVDTALTPVGCPTAFEQIGQVALEPESGADIGEEASEAVFPSAAPGEEAQEQMHEQRGPHLPLDGVGVVPEEVDQLHRLLELFEKDLDGPAATVEVGDGAGTPREVVGEKDHLAFHAFDLDQGGDPAQDAGIILPGVVAGEEDEFIAQDAGIGVGGQTFFHPRRQVILGPGDEKDPALGERPQVGKVQVGFVKEHDLTVPQAGAHLGRPRAVVLPGGIDDGEAGQEALQVDPQVALRRRLASPVLRPVHARGDQLDGRGVHHMDRPAEAPAQALVPATAKAGMQGLQVRQHCPEEFFTQRTSPAFVGVTERVARRGRGPAHRPQGADLEPQRVAYVVQTQRVADLRIKHRHHMAPRAERAGLAVGSGFPRQLWHQMRRNQFDELPQHGNVTAARLFCCFIFHTLPSGR